MRMFRRPRLWSKKRGSRLAGWQVWGAVGEALFFAVLFLLGVLTLSGTIASQVIRPNPEAMRFGFGFWVLILSSVSFVLIGGGSLAFRIIRVGSSNERQAAKIRPSEEFQPRRPSRILEFPTVPNETGLTDSPGIRLTYRLPAAGSPMWLLLSSALLVFSWNTVLAVLVGIELARIEFTTSIWDGLWWIRLFVLTAFSVVGWQLLKYFFSVLRRHIGLGSVIVELSDHPLRPGCEYELYIAQFGRLLLRRLEIDLVCEEAATFRQGTDVRVEKQLVRRENLWSEANVRIDPTQGWEQQFTIRVPVDAMHSFHSPHNTVCWKIEIRGESRRWPSYCRNFPVVVHPIVNANSGR